jgi:large subunit ribosomal protein L10
MHRSEKERVVEELTERLRTTQTLIVADYRGLKMPEIDALRTELLKHGARFSVVKNTLTRRAAEAAGADALLALLEGPSAIAFLEADGDPVAVAKALGETAKTTRVLALRGGLLEGTAITAEDVESLAKLPPADVLRAQLAGAIVAPLATVVGIFNAPLRNLVGVIDARIRQLEEQGPAQAAEPAAAAEPAQAEAEPEAAAAEEPQAEEPQAEEPQAEEPQAEEPQAEEPQAEEPQAEAAAPEPADEAEQEPAQEQEEEG